ncbi:MAG: HD domain-containing phosphohydrolase [Phycisphaerae bacterium]
MSESVGAASIDERTAIGKSTSTRAGYLPVPLTHIPAGAFTNIPIFLRVQPDRAGADAEPLYAPYLNGERPLNEEDRERLLHSGVELVYVRMADQRQFHDQAESEIRHVAADPRMAISSKATIIYETGLELVNEVLTDPDRANMPRRMEGVARSIATMVLSDPSSFSHLFTASHHDFYTATHLVNVATSLVPLAYQLGYRSTEDLTHICEAGLLHDIGKLYVPEEVLNKQGKLTEDDWWLLRRHPEMGCEHIAAYADIDPLVTTVIRQHHERLDGSGYPDGLRDQDIHPISRMCAVVDAFDAMTAFRPFKQRTIGVDQALEILKSETPAKHDGEVMEAWVGMVRAARSTVTPHPPAPPDEEQWADQREHKRYCFNCPARLHAVGEGPAGPQQEGPAQPVVAYNISRAGLGVLSQKPVRLGQRVHVYLLARSWNLEYLEADIVRCEDYVDGWYEVGMRFVKLHELGGAGNASRGNA